MSDVPDEKSVEEKLAELQKHGIGCPRAIEIRGPRAIEDWADDHLERLELESWVADCAGRGIFCPPEVAKEGREAVVDWLHEHDTAGRTLTVEDGGGEGPESRELEVLELLEGVDPIEVLETIVNQSSELLAKMREEADGGRDPVELLEELVSSVPAPEGFLVWVRQVAGRPISASEALGTELPRVPTDETEVPRIPHPYSMEIDRLKSMVSDHGELIESLRGRVEAQESQGADLRDITNALTEFTDRIEVPLRGGPVTAVAATARERPAAVTPGPPPRARPRRRKRPSQCEGTTKAGKRCRRTPVSGDVFCPQHGGVTGRKKAAPAKA